MNIDSNTLDLPARRRLIMIMKGKTLLFAFALYFVSYILIVSYVGIWKYSQHKVISHSDTLRDAKMEKLNREIYRLLQLKEPTFVEGEKLGNVEGNICLLVQLCWVIQWSFS